VTFERFTTKVSVPSVVTSPLTGTVKVVQRHPPLASVAVPVVDV